MISSTSSWAGCLPFAWIAIGGADLDIESPRPGPASLRAAASRRPTIARRRNSSSLGRAAGVEATLTRQDIDETQVVGPRRPPGNPFQGAEPADLAGSGGSIAALPLVTRAAGRRGVLQWRRRSSGIAAEKERLVLHRDPHFVKIPASSAQRDLRIDVRAALREADTRVDDGVSWPYIALR